MPPGEHTILNLEHACKNKNADNSNAELAARGKPPTLFPRGGFVELVFARKIPAMQNESHDGNACRNLTRKMPKHTRPTRNL